MDSVPGGSHYDVIFYTRREIFLLLQNVGNEANSSEKLFFIEAELSKMNGCSVRATSETKKDFPKLVFKFKDKWQAVTRKLDTFLRKNEKWLKENLSFYKSVGPRSSTPTATGRPKVGFSVSSERTKRRKTEEMREKYSPEELSYGTQMSLRSVGKTDAAKVVRNVTLTTPTMALKYQRAFEREKEETISGDKALSIVVQAKLSKTQYNILRQSMKEGKCKLYPSYVDVQKAKHKCYPTHEAIKITENSAEVQLQALLDHTSERILQVQKEVLQSPSLHNVNELCLVIKWGCDGSSGQSEYKQTFSNEDDSDSSIFVISLVPLQLKGQIKNNENECIVWKNPRPSSPRFCRPIKLQFARESSALVVREVKEIENQISLLVPYKTTIDGKIFVVHYKLALTMIDGKISNMLTSTSSSQRCYLCNSTSKEFNNIEKMISLPCKEENLKFGLSILHAWIRSFECILHLSYKLDIKKWQVRTEQDKHQVAERKQKIQDELKTKLGLLVDHPKPGFGSSNDGNTARRFFKDELLSHNITGVDLNIIHRFHTILQVISSGHEIKVSEFERYCFETAQKFVELYPWYYMPTSIHKILIHGSKIIQFAILPIGQLSEEAQEARNKDFKSYRERYSRKCSREKTMADVFHWLLVSSDPLITSQRKLPKKHTSMLSPDAINLLDCPLPELSEDDEDVDCNDDFFW